MIDRRHDPLPVATASAARAVIRPALSGDRPEPCGAAMARDALCRHLPLALAAALAAPVAASEGVRVEPLWLAPPGPPTETRAPAAYAVPALLSLPPGWSAGDAAALVAGDRPGPEDARDRLVAALLDERAAVLEVDVHTARGVSADSAAAPAAPAPDDLLPDLFAGLLALRRDAGAGPVVALGYGAGGRAALLAAGEPVAAGLLGPGGPRFAAAAALGPGRPAFAAGAPPPPEAAWRSRAPLLCATLGALAGAPGTGSDGRAAVSAEAAERDCAAALAPPAAAPPIRAPALVPAGHGP